VTAAVLRALATIGCDAEACMPVLRRAATVADRALMVPAARSLWRITGDPGPALTAADQCLAQHNEEYAWRDAADLLAELGRATEAQLARLRQLRGREDPTGWTPLLAAHALWRITGDPGPLLPALEQAWTANALTRSKVASLWTELGPAVAAARPLLTAELDQTRRHNRTTYSNTNVPDDEELLVRCRAALAAIETGA
jgi:hypothetical protein